MGGKFARKERAEGGKDPDRGNSETKVHRAESALSSSRWQDGQRKTLVSPWAAPGTLLPDPLGIYHSDGQPDQVSSAPDFEWQESRVLWESGLLH